MLLLWLLLLRRVEATNTVWIRKKERREKKEKKGKKRKEKKVKTQNK